MNKSVINRLKIQLADELIVLEDGYKYYYPTKRGALSASALRDIADTLDAINKDWGKQVHDELMKEREHD